MGLLVNSEESLIGDFGIPTKNVYANVNSMKMNRMVDKTGEEMLNLNVTFGFYLSKDARDAGARPCDKMVIKEKIPPGLSDVWGVAYDSLRTMLKDHPRVTSLENVM